MLSPPDDLATDDLLAAMTRQWGVAVVSAQYRAAGFGSHHWTLHDPAGGGWFLTVDDLQMTRRAAEPDFDGAYARLRQALATARALRDAGDEFVVAPVPTAGAEPLARVADRYAASLFPLIDGESFDFGEFAGPDHRGAVLEMVIRLHRAPPAARRNAPVDDLAVRKRDSLEAALDGEPVAAPGPFAEKAALLLAENAEGVRGVLERFDALVARADRGRDVITHGEPHPGNTMRTPDGWRLIDWDTVKLAPPERDLWLLGGDLRPYTEATGVAIVPEMLELFRLRWEITDLAIETDRFRRPHTGNLDDEEGWTILRSVVDGICR